MGTNRIVFWESQSIGNQLFVDGADGVTVNPDVFNSVTGAFQTNGVIPGDLLTIIGGANAGVYVILAVASETQLTVVDVAPPNWPGGGLLNEVYTIGCGSDFQGLPPSQDAPQLVIAPSATPQYGCVHYNNLMRGGLFDFEAFTGVASPPGSPMVGIEQWGTNPLTDWIRIMQFRLYLDLDTPLTALAFDIISPEGDESPIFLKGWDTFYNIGAATGSGDQDSYAIQHQDFVLRPGCSLRLTTTGADAAIVQAAEVWWERERQVVPNTHGDDYFAYNG